MKRQFLGSLINNNMQPMLRTTEVNIQSEHILETITFSKNTERKINIALYNRKVTVKYPKYLKKRQLD